MSDGEPTEEQKRIAQEGTEEEQLTLANNPDSSDAVLLLLKKASLRVVEAALKHAHTDQAMLALLNGTVPPEEWLVKQSAPLIQSDDTLLGETFARSSRPSARAAAATHFRQDAHRALLLDDDHAQVRLAAVEAMKSAKPLRDHLAARDSSGHFKEKAKHIRTVADARARALEAPQPPQANSPQAQVIL